MIVQKITSTYSLNGVSYETRVVYVVYESLLGKKGRKRERRRKIVQTDSMEIEIPKVFSNTCVRLRNGCASHSHRIRTICKRIESMRRLFALRKHERTARKYDFSPAVIESNPCLFLSLPLLRVPQHTRPIRIVDNVITAIYLRSLY